MQKLPEIPSKGRNIAVQHGPCRIVEKGAPSFRILHKAIILGCLKVEAIGANMDEVLKSGKISKYLPLSQIIIFTDYLHFIVVGAKGAVRAWASLAFASDLKQRAVRVKPRKQTKWRHCCDSSNRLCRKGWAFLIS